MTTQGPILIVEDDEKLAALLADYVRAEGLSPICESHGARAVARARSDAPAAILLDLMLPGMDGIEVCRSIRGFSAAPVIMLTARIDEIDRIAGLDVGADDYVCKPFSPREVMARLRAQLRRAAGGLAASQPWQIDEAAMRIIWRGEALTLTPVEYRLLRTLLRRPGVVFGRAQLLDALHDDFRDVSDRAIDSHVKNIRRKLAQADPACDCLASVYGVGYRLDPPDAG